MKENTRINALKGIGEKMEQLFSKLGIYTIGDLIRYYPRGYDIYEEPVPISELEEGKTQTVTGTIYGKVQVSPNRKMQVTSVQVRDFSGVIRVIWFRMPFLRSTLSAGGVITLRGQVIRKKNGLVMEHPEIFYPSAKYEEKLHTLQPVYPLTAGLSNNMVMKAVRQALDGLDLSREILPEEIRHRYHLAEYNYAVRGIHFPEDKEVFYRARERLVFEEFLEFIVSLRKLKDENEKKENHFVIEHKAETERFISSLPYRLTDAQKKVWKEIELDMGSRYAMSRLIQGDVGSGKTIVAVLALISVGMNGYQGAMMAPTEVLARQHFESITKLFDTYQIPLKVGLLTGSMTAKEKKEAYARIEAGEVQVIIGTHALIQEKVHYKNLALAITDEQHRFGVRQRETFFEKGSMPHILVMSATPIPRTLAIIIYGDLDISVIDQLPANRLPIKNCVVDTSYRETAYRFIKKQTAEGRQCYIICPMVEESEHLEAENVIDYTSMLQEEIGDDIVIDYLHGKMKQAEKDRIMERFSRNEIQVLVSTTVIEVGIDVPNATVMMVENAERFGLAQLHQLRGRVGRGKYQSYCIFMSGSKSKETKERLEILNKTNDGFKIASEDLKLRGPGDLFGIRQSGIMDFKLGDVFQDAKILQMANEAADQLIKTDHEWMQKMEKEERTSSVIL
ncbi:ATP-dependent DNA helicase RecG [Dorea acetigenes]|uniref:ATP-dependent DNA helicase RecG n=1 Tax=Dorea acetigenes TaxID=2981787 RepID=A0ABT2RJC2_9FIRM|nr:ATP-dependent DNA helicase RecG [Dorea acetigenes]MCU6685441.1 ATP-dependent DNA helicase RecG [Dorea acetigenes]SCI52176.1 ATP-dependent DNA helicase recG [uncultured Clostridium sp.]